MTRASYGRASLHRQRTQTDRRMTAVPPASTEDVLSALDDADCRAMLRALDEPRSAGDLVERCEIPSTTAYRKLDRLTGAGLVAERTALRAGFRQVTEYVRTFESVRVRATDDGLTVAVEARERSPEDRLSALWSAVGDEA